MTKRNILNVELFNSQLNKLKSGIKNITEVTLNLSSNWLEILAMRLIFYMSYYWLIHKLQGFVKLLQMIHQLI